MKNICPATITHATRYLEIDDQGHKNTVKRVKRPLKNRHNKYLYDKW